MFGVPYTAGVGLGLGALDSSRVGSRVSNPSIAFYAIEGSRPKKLLTISGHLEGERLGTAFPLLLGQHNRPLLQMRRQEGRAFPLLAMRSHC